MNKNLFMIVCLIWGSGFSAAWTKEPETLVFPDYLEADLSAGTSAIYHLDFRTAEMHFRRAIQMDPHHPAAYFFRLMATWYRLTYDSLLNRDKTLEDLLKFQANLTEKKAKNYSRDRNSKAVGYLYRGGALGAKGWYMITRGRWIRAYFSGKKGYNYIRKVIKMNPQIFDAYLGVGMYEYYAATLGPTLRVLASFAIRGNKETSIRYLKLAESQSRYVRLEASYFLWNAAIEEGRLDDSALQIQTLRRSFPLSPLFAWCELQTLYSQSRWQDVMDKSLEYIRTAESDSLGNMRGNPFKLMLSKVYYHAGMSAYQMGDTDTAKSFFDQSIQAYSDFEGWKSLAYLRRGELYDLEGNRADALKMYRNVLNLPNVWGSHKRTKKRIRRPYRKKTIESYSTYQFF